LRTLASGHKLILRQALRRRVIARADTFSDPGVKLVLGPSVAAWSDWDTLGKFPLPLQAPKLNFGILNALNGLQVVVR